MSIHSRFSSRWPSILLAAWIGLAFVILALFLSGTPERLDQIRDYASSYDWALDQLGLSIRFFVFYFTALDLVIVITHFAVAIVIAWRRPDDWVPLLVSVTLVTVPLTATGALTSVEPAWTRLAHLVSYLGLVSSVNLLYLFPDGRFVPRWTRPLGLVWTVLHLPILLFPEASASFQNWPLALRLAIPLTWSAAGVYAQVFRYRHVSSREQKQQIKWAALGLTAAVLAPIGYYASTITLPSLSQPNLPGFFSQLAGPTVFSSFLLFQLVVFAVYTLLLLLFPLSFAVAILRYRLWDIDILLNRTLVYGSLTGIVVGLYVLIVGGVGVLFQTQNNLAVTVLATGLIALLVQPLRGRLQREVNRLMYGERDDPVEVLSRLGQRLEATAETEAVLPGMVETIAHALRLPYAAIALKRDSAFEIVAAQGRTPPKQVVLPLVYQGELVGRLVVAPRAPGEGFSPADEHLLESVARQAGAAVHAVRLTADLKRSRERLVAAREEERRRLHRDLHDDLGPQLASLTLKVDAVRNLLERDPAAADELLLEMKSQTRAAIADVRRLVYDLRPPTLDQFGLVPLLREQASTRWATNGLHVTVDAPDAFPPLAAAVEVAAYRIVMEALTNVVRHAHATQCAVRLTPDSDLLVEIADNGVGIPGQVQSGVGLASMRERAAELGGTCVIEAGDEGGTLVRARLPLGDT